MCVATKPLIVMSWSIGPSESSKCFERPSQWPSMGASGSALSSAVGPVLARPRRLGSSHLRSNRDLRFQMAPSRFLFAPDMPGPSTRPGIALQGVGERSTT